MMEGSMEPKDRHYTFMMEHDIDNMIHHYSSMKELSKGFEASRSSSSSLDETTSNSSLSSSSVSLYCALSSNSLSERPHYQPCSFKKRSMAAKRTQPVPVASRLPWLLLNEESKCSTSTSKEVKDSDGMWQFRYRYRRLSPQKLLSVLSSFNRDQWVWEEVEDDLYILLDGRLDRLQVCRDFYVQQTNNNNLPSEGRLGRRRSCEFLLRLGYLLSSKQHKDMAMHDEHAFWLASFLSTGRDARHLKLAVVRTLYEMCLASTSPKNGDRSSGTITNDDDTQSGAERLYDFLTHRTREWDDELLANNNNNNDLSTVAMSLVYELRAKCLRHLDLERDRIRSVSNTGDSTAVIIATGAKIVELGIQKSNKAMEGQISNAGQKMKGWIDNDVDVGLEDQQQQPEQKSSRILSYIRDRDAEGVRAVSGSTKRASEYARQSSKRVAESTLDTTLSSLYTIGTKVEESTDRIDQLSPENREIIKAAGKIGIASVGAVALVAEAVIETSRSLSSKTVGVTADLVGHKYGSVAGEVARDAADTYTNVLQTMKNITLASNGSKLVKKATKNAGKNQIDEDVEKAKQMILRLERQGAMVAKHTLGIQWAEGSLTRELLCDAAVSDDDKQGSACITLSKGNFRLDNNINDNSSPETKNDDTNVVTHFILPMDGIDTKVGSPESLEP